MTSLIPAWSESFHDGGPGDAPALHLGVPITREWAYGTGDGAGVTVAVVDSGVDGSHPLLAGTVDRYIAVEVDANEPDGVRFVEGEHDDLFGHGTACAAIIRSLAPAARLISVRVLGGNLKGSAFAFAHGLDWCIENGVDVVNLSLSTTNEDYLTTFYDLVDQAVFKRMMVVSAMNNERKRSIPSEFAGVFSVACAPTTDREQLWCNPTAPAEWGAAGVDVDVAWAAGATITASGNSFAAPVITGHIARIIAAHPGLTTWQVRTILAALAQNAPPVDAGSSSP